MAWTSAGDKAESRSLLKLADKLVADSNRLFDRRAKIVCSETSSDVPSGTLGPHGTIAVNIADSHVWVLNDAGSWVQLT